MGCCGRIPGEGLIAAAAALSAALAQGRTAEELNTLAAFFTVLGDDLALLALQAPGCGESQGTGGLTSPGPAQ